MVRLPRIVIPDEPLHIMYRGNSSHDNFFNTTRLFSFFLTSHTVKALSGLMRTIGRSM